MKVSIIIPCLNADAFIRRGLESALLAGAQVPGKWQIIAVDNGSTDQTLRILHEFAVAHAGRVRVESCLRPGASAARNHGVSVSSGEWLQFLDADDTIAPDKISHQLELAGSADWVVGAYRHLHPDGSMEDSIPQYDLWRGLFFNFETGCTHSNLIRRTALENVGGWDEKLSSNQDPELWFRLLKAKVPHVIDPTVKSFYHHHAGTRITGRDPAGTLQRRIAMLAAANAYLHAEKPEYWYARAPFFLGSLLRSVRMLATYDLEAAAGAYSLYFGPAAPWPIAPPYELVPRYARLYPYLGFRKLERLRLALAGVLPASIKQQLKK